MVGCVIKPGFIQVGARSDSCCFTHMQIYSTAFNIHITCYRDQCFFVRFVLYLLQIQSLLIFTCFVMPFYH